MSQEKYDKYKNIFKENNGILRASTAIKLGIPKHIIYEMIHHDELVKEARGLYRLSDLEPLGNPDLVQVSLLIPKSVIFLLSSLFFHGYTTQIPRYVYISLPHEIKRPRVNYPPLKVFYRSEKQFISGIEKHTIDGINVRIYNLEKTITDCFKYRDKIGRDIALEAFKEYMGKPNPQIHRIMEYAKINQVENVIRPYIETLS